LFSVRTVLMIIIVCAVLGIADASYLTYMSYRELPLPCTILEGCNEVAASPYSKIFGVPLSLFGVLFYALVAIVSGTYLVSKRELLRGLIMPLASVGFLLSVYFTYLQAFKIGAFCIYCIFSATMSAIIFMSAIYLRRLTNAGSFNPPNLPQQ